MKFSRRFWTVLMVAVLMIGGIGSVLFVILNETYEPQNGFHDAKSDWLLYEDPFFPISLRHPPEYQVLTSNSNMSFGSYSGSTWGPSMYKSLQETEEDISYLLIFNISFIDNPDKLPIVDWALDNSYITEESEFVVGQIASRESIRYERKTSERPNSASVTRFLIAAPNNQFVVSATHITRRASQKAVDSGVLTEIEVENLPRTLSAILTTLEFTDSGKREQEPSLRAPEPTQWATYTFDRIGMSVKYPPEYWEACNPEFENLEWWEQRHVCLTDDIRSEAFRFLHIEQVVYEGEEQIYSNCGEFDSCVQTQLIGDVEYIEERETHLTSRSAELRIVHENETVYPGGEKKFYIENEDQAGLMLLRQTAFSPALDEYVETIISTITFTDS